MIPHIIYEDTHLLVLHKPAGVPVQSAKVGTKDCVSILKNYLYKKEPKKGEPYLGLIHRLDQPVEGLLVFARNPAAARDLSRQAADGTMKKYYLAIRRNVDKPRDVLHNERGKCGKTPANVDKPVDNWIIQVDYLKKNGRENISQIVPKGTPAAKRAELKYRILGQQGEFQLLEIELLTGRHHQIRVQMAGLGTPLLGDKKYGVNVESNVDNFAAADPALCAYRLEFIHPRTKKRLLFQMKPENPCFSQFLE